MTISPIQVLDEMIKRTEMFDGSVDTVTFKIKGDNFLEFLDYFFDRGFFWYRAYGQNVLFANPNTKEVLYMGMTKEEDGYIVSIICENCENLASESKSFEFYPRGTAGIEGKVAYHHGIDYTKKILYTLDEPLYKQYLARKQIPVN